VTASPKSPDIELSVILPVRNEGINLRIMLKMLKAMVEVPHEVLVVYDFLEDETVPVIRDLRSHYPNVRGVHNRLGAGVINAIRAGVEGATGKNVLIFAADEVGPVLAIEDMLALMAEGCEFVSCTRYAHGGRRLGGSLIGGVLSRLANRLFRYIAGCRMSDVTTGIKMFRRDTFSRFDLRSNPVGWAVAFEMSIKAHILGLRLGEVPIISIDRLYGGQSTFRVNSWTREYLRWFLWGARQLRKLPEESRRQVRVKIPLWSASPTGDESARPPP
jgi:glycosyltransferase involved in cell wall biosynthesis